MVRVLQACTQLGDSFLKNDLEWPPRGGTKVFSRFVLCKKIDKESEQKAKRDRTHKIMYRFPIC